MYVHTPHVALLMHLHPCFSCAHHRDVGDLFLHVIFIGPTPCLLISGPLTKGDLLRMGWGLIGGVETERSQEQSWL